MRRSDEVVFPNRNRAKMWLRAAAINPRDIRYIFNSPLARDWKIDQGRKFEERDVVIHYHGNISSRLLPLIWLDVIKALPNNFKLSIAGYEAQLSRGYIDEFLSSAERLQINSRVKYLGPLARTDLLEYLEHCDIGIGVMPYGLKQNINEANLFPASNKIWDYLSCGLTIVVDKVDVPQFPFKLAGALRKCDSTSVQSIVESIMANSDWELTSEMCREFAFENRFDAVVRSVSSEASLKRSDSVGHV